MCAIILASSIKEIIGISSDHLLHTDDEKNAADDKYLF